MLANKSADSTHRFQPFQPSSAAGWKSWTTKPTENGFLPIEHEKTQPTKPTRNGWSQ